MNDQRRKMIDDIGKRLDEVRADIETARDEEQESFDNLPEGIQDSHRGDAMRAAVDNLDYAVTSAEEAIEFLAAARNGE